MTSRSRLRAALVSSAFLVPSVLVGPPAAVAAPPPEPALRLVAAANAVTIQRYPGEEISYLGLGTHLVAGRNPFELRVTRRSYRDPIVATQVLRTGSTAGTGSTAKTRALPAGLVKDFSGLTDFVRVTLVDAAGRKVVDRRETVCPNAFDSRRTRPDAPPTSPYAPVCAYNPFTLGSVQGIQAGWSTSTGGGYGRPFGEPAPVEVPDGTYTATITIDKTYRDFFGIPAAQATATVKATLKTVEPPEEPPHGRADAAATPGRHRRPTRRGRRGGPACPAPRTGRT